MRAFHFVLTAILAVSLATTPLAHAKGDVRATLENPSQLARAHGGEHLRIAFAMNVAPRLPILDPHGRVPPHPFGASGVYLRFTPAKGGAPVIVASAKPPPGARGYPAGRYVAAVTVPPGGIRALAIGLEGYQYVEGGPPRRSDVFFAIVNDPFAAGARGATAHARDEAIPPWGLLAGGLGVAVLLLLAYRGRGLRRVAV
jgi:hypothetical protein